MTHLVDIRIQTKSMFSWAQDIGIGSADIGYIVHSLICAAYGRFRMQPFRHFEEGDRIRVLGYSSVSAEELTNERAAVAQPAVSAAILSELSKEMPSAWAEGASYSFQVKAAPIVQVENRTVDAFRRAPKGSTRDEVYLKWFARKTVDAASILNAKLDAFSLETVSRRPAQKNEEGKRPLGKQFTIPAATISGILSVANSDEFLKLISRGIGRHTGFGFGAVLLRPAKP
ncbi:type I-E CRISPR-associated protein Cas6/Cse3/CasE [Roseibium sp. RKSG952]|uniref:type I-E CRISPR-associated protein Cas6/Cse3/CasE n=1 Tax=Roseibium sp. RKSG952 TaxID=2529384 RepID=UPI0012BC5385|nr:type I-E CRISPR-associated protein Cas6/Cse3/CasE [Roseibium sp. RKSG952]MTH95642.1 type I-E CRISPR-associated protein Cas6/Cse3/CasE [Roseibium sp. RKSG952]